MRAQVKLQEAHSRSSELWDMEHRPELIFGRLWDRLKLPAIGGRGFIGGAQVRVRRGEGHLVTVLHRLFEAGSDRQAARWMTLGVSVAGSGGIQFTPSVPCDALDGRGRGPRRRWAVLGSSDLFIELSLVFFDTTSIYFEGRGGETLGQLGCSKDRRGDHKQVVVGALLT